MYRGEDKCIGFWWGNMTERDNLGSLDIDGSIIQK
jgi:hypothetical protein